MKIREAILDDLQTIVDIYNQSIPYRKATADLVAVTVEERLEWFNKFSSDRKPIWVLETDFSDQIVGWLSLKSFYGREAYRHTAEISVYIDYHHHRKGYADILIKHALTEAKSWEINNILAYIFSNNISSIQLFEKYGFKRWGLLPGIAEMDSQLYSLEIWGLTLS